MVATLCGCQGSKKAIKFISSDGQQFAKVGSDRQLNKSEYKAYLEVVISEAEKILVKQKKISKENARKQLYKGGFTIYTAFDTKISKNLTDSCEQMNTKVGIAAAITDLNANLVAVYSSKTDENLAIESKPPCSALKPLSVYAPAIDNGTIKWSSRYEDSPYKYIKNLEGVMRPWPNNSTNVFSERYAYIYQAVKESLNTVAVKCLADYGINKSINFLEEKFAVPLSYEKEVSAKRGEEEVMGNIALGFLSKGVSTVDMAGYYQIFANGGKYAAPKTILKICDFEGNEIYLREYSQKQVIKPTTADMMNHILKEVVSPGGTGEKAKCEKVQVAGKTGTDDLGENNWFVGVTPEYSAAFWHGLNDRNVASQIFSTAFNAIYNELPSAKSDFTYTSSLIKVVYCTETGKRAGAGCGLIHMGYFTKEELPGPCDRH